MFGTIGVQEMVVIFIVALVLFGPKKLPELGRTIGKALTEFRRASTDLKASFEREMHNLEREAELEKTKAEVKSALPAASEYDYSYTEFGEYSPDSASHTATNSTTVSATETPGAESHGTEASVAEHVADDVSEHVSETVAETPHVIVPAEGTVARVESAVEPRVESAPQHS
jgi:TatA/E family protein of Tat protein translocase